MSAGERHRFRTHVATVGEEIPVWRTCDDCGKVRSHSIHHVRSISVDPKCFELAQHFLPDRTPETEELADWIQYHVELFLTGNGVQL